MPGARMNEPVAIGVPPLHPRSASLASLLAEAVRRRTAGGLLAAYKGPRAFHPVVALPRAANGKVLRRALKAAQA